MIHLVYLSSATHLFSKQELLDLLQKARSNNHQLNVSGMLLYKDGNFIQVLEGEAAQVRPLFETINRDPRHSGVIVLLDEEISERQFPDWSMGFRDLSDKAVQSLPGFSQFMNQADNLQRLKEDPTGCLDLLNFFRESR